MIYLAVFVSGFCVMVIEIIGARFISPYFGSSVYVWGSVISVFMVALATGYYAGGWLSARSASYRVFGLFYIIPALVSIVLIEPTGRILLYIANEASDPRFGALAACFILFFVPVSVLGAISPYSIRLIVVRSHLSGQQAGQLYFLSTVGSAVGTLLTSFYFILWASINTIAVLNACALVMMGVVLVMRGNRAQ